MSDSKPTHNSRPGQFVPPSLEDLDSVLSAYEFIEILGQGGMGAVYKVRQHSLDRMAAIKVMPKFEEEEGENFAERFQREARAMGRLTHSNIISVYDFGQTSDGMLYIVMEYVDGADLQQMMRTGEMTLDHLFDWIPQVCSALDYAHSEGIIHRDIKPGNIMIGRDGTVKVADFGLAKLTGGDGQHPRLTMTNMAMGTPDYVAPEVLEMNVEADHRADIYAIGVMLYEMLTGKIPRGAWRPPSELNSHIDSRFDELVTRAMDPERDSRYQAVSEITARLLSIRTTTDDSVPIITDGTKGDRSGTRITGRTSGSGRSKTNTGLWIGITTIALAVIGSLIYFLKPAEPVDEAEFQVAGADSGVMPGESNKGTNKRLASSSETAEKISDLSKPVPDTPLPPPEKTAAPSPAETTAKAASSPPEPEAPKPDTVIAKSKKEESTEPEKTAPVKSDAADEIKPKKAEPVAPSGNAMAAAPTPAPMSEGMRRVSELLNRYRSGYERTMLAPHEKSLAALNSQYTRALERKKDLIAASGNLNEVLAFRNEIERVGKGEALPESDKEIPESLSQLRTTYEDQLGRLNETHLDRISTLIAPLNSEFISIEQELTKSGKVDDALEVQQERISLNKEGLPFVDFDTTSLFSAIEIESVAKPSAETAGNTPLGNPEDEAERIAAENRKAAEWVLSKGGRVEIKIGENTVELQGQNENSAKEVAALLPASDFELIAVNFLGKRDITNEEFSRFPPSPSLLRLDLDQTLFSGRASVRVLRGFPKLEELSIPHSSADEWAAGLDEVPTLRHVSFYRTLLSDDGARDVSKLTWLTSLQLSSSRITPRALDSLAMLTNLKELSLSDLINEFGDEDLEKLTGLTNLKLLTLHKWKVTPEAVRKLKDKLRNCSILYTNADGQEEKL